MGRSISAVDLFCGAGGLTHGLLLEGLNVRAGVDIDPACRFPYQQNNDSHFIEKSVDELDGKELRKYFKRGEIRLLAGCAPCQPFSTYTQGLETERDGKWRLLYEFSRLVKEVRPEIVTMENVPKLVKHRVFADFVGELRSLGYTVTYHNVECTYYGIPQTRKRLVLFASVFGEVSLLPPTHGPLSFATVRETIEVLDPIEAGSISLTDPLHRSSQLSEKNLERMRASHPGGTWRDWDKTLRAKCHRQRSGKTYPSVYGRMNWDAPAPTITTQSYGFGNGRFGHPEQDRAISLREAALLQTFPRNYEFVPPNEDLRLKKIGLLIGNAVPVKLGQVIAQSILRHLQSANRL